MKDHSNLVEVGTGEVNKSSGFGALWIVEEVESILAILVLEHKVKTLPLLVLLAFLQEIAL